MPLQKEKKAAELQEKQQFDSGFKESEKREAGTPELNSSFITPLGQTMFKMFSECERQRRLIEERWLKDLRQHRGEYDPEVLASMHPKRSRAFLSLTRGKVNTITARQMDILFPANGEKNWGIQPTPIPEMNPMVMQSIVEQMIEATGQQPSEDEIKKIINDEARKRSDNMEKEMADQLAELRYRTVIRNVIRSGNLYGTGILKGPMVKKTISKRWLPDGAGGWVAINIERLLPYCEFVPLWDIYPDMTSREPEDMRHIFQRYVMTPNKLFALSQREDFNGKAIRAYMKAYPQGDAKYKTHEELLRNMSPGSEIATKFADGQDGGHVSVYNTSSEPIATGRFEVREFWGYLSAEELMRAGVKIDEKQLGMEVAANIWTLGEVVIKAIVSPIEGVDLPYYFYHYTKDETSIFGEGVPFIMRDAQMLFNASVRAMLDNAAISAGPIIEANTDLLHPKEDPTDLYPFRVFQRTGSGMEASANAIKVFDLKSYTPEYLQMVKFFHESADEVTTVPRFMQDGVGARGSAAKTASGLSMMMGAANITIKDQIKYFDDGITKPFIKSLYYWNMDFNPKESIKGDYDVVTKGTSSLIAKEVQAEKLIQFLGMTANDFDMTYMNRDVALREMAKIMDLDEIGLIKDPDQVAIETEQQNKAMEADKAFEQKLALMKAESGGHMGGPVQQEGEQITKDNLIESQQPGGVDIG